MIYDNPWYANISPETGELGQENCNIVNNRHHGARKDLKELLKLTLNRIDEIEKKLR